MSASRINYFVNEARKYLLRPMIRSNSRSTQTIQNSSLLNICTFLLENRGNKLNENDLQLLENMCMSLNKDEIGCSEPPTSLWKRHRRAGGKPLVKIFTVVPKTVLFLFKKQAIFPTVFLCNQLVFDGIIFLQVSLKKN